MDYSVGFVGVGCGGVWTVKTDEVGGIWVGSSPGSGA